MYRGYIFGENPTKMRNPSSQLWVKLRERACFAGDRVLGCFHDEHPVDPITKLPRIGPIVPDPTDVRNQLAAIFHRFACEMPDHETPFANEFREHVAAMLRHMRPVDDSDVLSLKAWLKRCPYSRKRKLQLIDELDKLAQLTSKQVGNSSFIKDESYDQSEEKDKAPRAINSYLDITKVMLGPLVHALDKATFKYGNNHGRFFVKGTSPREWPRMLDELFGNRPCVSSDFSSFEAHHTGLFAEVTQMWVKHMLSGTSFITQRDLMLQMMSQFNVCEFSAVQATVRERLMSGALWTSSSNGFLNLMIMSFFTKIATGWSSDEVYANMRGRVEGDDGIFEDCGVSKIDPAILGCVMDLTPHVTVRHADFCSMITTEDGACLTDPLRVLQKFAVLPAALVDASERTKNDYLVGKARSYKHTFPGCPVIVPWAESIIARYPGAQPLRTSHHLSIYEKARLLSALDDEDNSGPTVITAAARELMQDRFGLSIATQKRLEDSLTKKQPIYLDDLVSDRMLSHAAAHYHAKSGGFPSREYPKFIPEIIEKVVAHRRYPYGPRSKKRPKQEVVYLAPVPVATTADRCF